MITIEPSTSLQTTKDELFAPLYRIEIPEDKLHDLIINQNALPTESLVQEFTWITQQLTKWLEAAHMIAFTIEQNIKRGDTEVYTITPLESSKVQSLIQLLTELCDEQEEIHTNHVCKLALTKIQSEWSGLQHFISFVKNLIDAANETHELRTLMEHILIQIDDLSTMIFQFQEKRHTAAIYPSDEDHTKKDDGILVEIDNRVGPLFTHVEKVYTRMTSAEPPEDTSGLLARKHILVQERWECLRLDIDDLKVELKEDRWLVVFRQVADQVDDMMNGLEKTVVQCQAMIQQIRENGNHFMSASLSTTSTSSSSSITSTGTDLRAKLRSIEKNFDAKYKYYTPSIAKMLMMLGNGIAARVSRNAATLQRHEAMIARWNSLKATMDQLRKREMTDMLEEHCSSRLSDRSDSTSGSHSWNHRNKNSPSLSHIEEPFMELARSKSPYSKFSSLHASSPSPLFMEEKSSRRMEHALWRGGSPISNTNGRRTTSPSLYARDNFSSVSSMLRPSSISPSNSRQTSSHFRLGSPDILEEKQQPIRATTPRAGTPRSNTPRSNTPRSNTPLSSTPRSTTPRAMTPRSTTPNMRRSGTPSLIPRPKTPNAPSMIPRPKTPSSSKIETRPRSSMGRNTTGSTPKYHYKPDPRDPLDKEVANIVNRSPIPIQCSKKSDHGDGKYYFGNELTPSLGGGKKIYTCKLMTYENSGRNKVLIRVGGGWQDLEIFLLEHMNLIG